MNKNKLLPVLLLAGVLGLAGCDKSSVDPIEIGNLDLVSNSYAQNVCLEAIGNLVNVVEFSDDYAYTWDNHSLAPYVDDHYNEYETYVFHFYNNQYVRKGTYKKDELYRNGDKNTYELTSEYTQWFAPCQDETTPEVMSLYSYLSEKGSTGELYTGYNINSGDFSTLDDSAIDWANFRYNFVYSSTKSSVDYASSYSYGLSGDTLVGYEISVSESSSSSHFIPNDSTIQVKVRVEDGQISRYVKNKTYGWVLDSSIYYEYEYMVTDYYGAALDEPVLCGAESYVLNYKYGKIVDKKSVPTYKEEFSNESVYLKQFDSTTYSVTNTSGFTDVTSSVTALGNPSYKNHLYRYYASLSANALISLTDSLHLNLETPDNEAWGYTALTETPNAKYVADAAIADHDFIKVLASGYYSISLELNETYEEVVSFTISYVHN